MEAASLSGSCGLSPLVMSNSRRLHPDGCEGLCMRLLPSAGLAKLRGDSEQEQAGDNSSLDARSESTIPRTTGPLNPSRAETPTPIPQEHYDLQGLRKESSPLARSRSSASLWRRSSRSQIDTLSESGEGSSWSNPPQENLATEVPVPACDSPEESSSQALLASKGGRNRRGVHSSPSLQSPTDTAQNLARFFGGGGCGQRGDDSLSLSISSAVLRGGSRIEADPGTADMATAVRSPGDLWGEAGAMPGTEKQPALKGGKALNNMMSKLWNRGGNLSAELANTTSDGLRRLGSQGPESPASPVVKPQKAGLTARPHIPRPDRTQKRQVRASVAPAVHCSSLSPASPMVVQQPVAPSISVLSSDMEEPRSPNAAAAAAAAAAAPLVPSPAVLPAAATAVVPASPSTSGVLQNVVVMVPVTPGGIVGAARDVLSPARSPETPSAEHRVQDIGRRKSPEDSKGATPEGAEVLQQLQDVLLGVLLLAVLCSLFFGKISAVVTTLSVGLLASRILLPLSSPGDGSTGSGHLHQEDISMQPADRGTEGSDSSGTELASSRGKWTPMRDPGAERRQQQIARIMQYNQTSDPKANTVMEGFLNAPAKHRGRR